MKMHLDNNIQQFTIEITLLSLVVEQKYIFCTLHFLYKT